MPQATDQPLSTEFIGAVRDATGLTVRVDDHTRGLYATDASIYQVSPLGVVFPERVEQIPQLLTLCASHGVPVLPRGGATSLAGQCVNHALVIDVSQHCHRMLRLDSGARQCMVEPGLTIDDLNDLIRTNGLFFAPDPSTARQANIGGCIGNNAAGVHSVLYGRTSETPRVLWARLGRARWGRAGDHRARGGCRPSSQGADPGPFSQDDAPVERLSARCGAPATRREQLGHEQSQPGPAPVRIGGDAGADARCNTAA